jgi:hypothetical protein
VCYARRADEVEREFLEKVRNGTIGPGLMYGYATKIKVLRELQAKQGAEAVSKTRAIWIVEGVCGEHEDVKYWQVCAYATEAAANRRVALCSLDADKLIQKARAKWGDDYWIHGDKLGTSRSDPDFKAGYYDTQYRAYPVELFEE